MAIFYHSLFIKLSFPLIWIMNIQFCFIDTFFEPCSTKASLTDVMLLTDGIQGVAISVISGNAAHGVYTAKTKETIICRNPKAPGCNVPSAAIGSQGRRSL